MFFDEALQSGLRQSTKDAMPAGSGFFSDALVQEPTKDGIMESTAFKAIENVGNKIADFTGIRTLAEKLVGETTQAIAKDDSQLQKTAEEITPTNKQTAGAALKLGSFFVPGGTIVKSAVGGASFSAGSQMEEGKNPLSAETAITTAASALVPTIITKTASKLLAPVMEKLAGLGSKELNIVLAQGAGTVGQVDDKTFQKFLGGMETNMMPKLEKLSAEFNKSWSQIGTDIIHDLIPLKKLANEDPVAIFKTVSRGLIAFHSWPLALGYSSVTNPTITLRGAYYLGKMYPALQKLAPVERNLVIDTIRNINQ